jgi:hypothetical protein
MESAVMVKAEAKEVVLHGVAPCRLYLRRRAARRAEANSWPDTNAGLRHISRPAPATAVMTLLGILVAKLLRKGLTTQPRGHEMQPFFLFWSTLHSSADDLIPLENRLDACFPPHLTFSIPSVLLHRLPALHLVIASRHRLPALAQR